MTCARRYTMLSLMIGLMYLQLGTAFYTIQDHISFLFYVAAFMVFMAIAVLPFCECPPLHCARANIGQELPQQHTHLRMTLSVVTPCA